MNKPIGWGYYLAGTPVRHLWSEWTDPSSLMSHCNKVVHRDDVIFKNQFRVCTVCARENERRLLDELGYDQSK